VIRAGDLKGRPVIDVDGAEKMGILHEIIVDPAAVRVAGLAVSGGVSFIGAQKQTLLPSPSVHAIGPDALMVRRPSTTESAPSYLTSLPRVSDLAGRRFITDTGRFIGHLADVLFDGEDGRIIGYEFRRPNGAGGLDALLGVGKGRVQYVKAEDNLRFGHDLIVIPDDAVMSGIAAEPEEEAQSVTARWMDIGTQDGVTREFAVQDQRKAS